MRKDYKGYIIIGSSMSFFWPYIAKVSTSFAKALSTDIGSTYSIDGSFLSFILHLRSEKSKLNGFFFDFIL